jgi:hypothetical protein
MTTVDFEPLTVPVPLREEPAGVLRVGKSRVLLELVIRALKAGSTAEAIVQSYDTLNPADVYAVFSRYLTDPAPFEDYLTRCDDAVAEVRPSLTSSA